MECRDATDPGLGSLSDAELNQRMIETTKAPARNQPESAVEKRRVSWRGRSCRQEQSHEV
jgi:hypothetical protein